ncbi:MAG: HAD family phosphatase [Gemmatimonadota bacterium]
MFDMDGLLLDSERLAMEYFVDACREHSIDPDLAVYRGCIGTRAEDTARILMQGYGPEFPFALVQATWTELYEAHVQERPVATKAGAIPLLNRCAELGIRCAVATSTASALARRKLELAGLLPSFEVLVTGDMVKRAKPDPEAYLKAAQALLLDPSACWALEDSAAGVRSALTAGFVVYRVPDLAVDIEPGSGAGYMTVDSLHDVLIALNHAAGG